MVNSRLKMVDESSKVDVSKKLKKRQKSFFVPNREAYDRINFLYQAAHLTLSQNPENVELSRFYISTAKKITEKLVLKIDPKIKRTICKCCHALLIPGITSTHRLQGKREKHMVVSCLTCKTVKRWRTSKCNVSKDEALELDEK